MLATFAIEIILLVIVLWRFGLKNTFNRLVAVMLLLLAVFQMAEYFVCGGMMLNSGAWSRVGFIAISLLPALGLHLARVIANNKTIKSKVLVVVSYINAIGWAVLFGFSDRAFQAYECTTNYAIFQLGSPYGGQYFVFYFGWLMVAIIASYVWAQKTKESVSTRLYWLIIGYAVFMIPAGITALVQPETMQGLPSIMCGFAVFFALILVFGILPARKLPHIIDKKR